MTTNSSTQAPLRRKLSAARPRFAGQSGFTLIEAVVATGILIVGLAAVSNLMVVAISSNSIANWTTGSAFIAGQKLEELRNLPFADPLLNDTTFTDSLDVDRTGYNEDVTVDGLGQFHTRWWIQTVAPTGAVSVGLKYISVRTEFRGPMSRRTRADFTTLRAGR